MNNQILALIFGSGACLILLLLIIRRRNGTRDVWR
jgi:hypothetical protein